MPLCWFVYSSDTCASLELFSNVIVGIALFNFSPGDEFLSKKEQSRTQVLISTSRHFHAILLSILLFT